MHESVDARRAVGPSSSISSRGRSSVAQEAEADGVVDVVVDVRDAIDDAHDLALERLRLLLARVREDAVADLVREVERARDPSDCSLGGSAGRALATALSSASSPA